MSANVYVRILAFPRQFSFLGCTRDWCSKSGTVLGVLGWLAPMQYKPLCKPYTLYIQVQSTFLQGTAKLLWSQRNLQLGNTPFSIVETRRLDCQFGQRCYKEKAQKSTRLNLQASRKLGSHAHTQVKKGIVYLEYKVTEEELKQLSLRTLKEKKMNALKLELVKNPTTVAEGITDKSQVQTSLRHYVMHELCSKAPPDPNDRAFSPTDNDLKNHIYMAKWALQLSCLDQENLHLKIEQWKNTMHQECTQLFWPYIQKGGIHVDESLSCSTAATPIKNKSSYARNYAVDDTTAITDNCSWYTNSTVGAPNTVAARASEAVWQYFESYRCHL